jgi:uncharacterized protein YkwD
MMIDCKRAMAGLLLLGLALVSACQTGGTIHGESRYARTNLETIRSSNGLPPLHPSAKLERAAAQQANYMARAGRMTHTVGPGKDFVSRMQAAGISVASAENVAYNVTDRGRLFGMWMASAGHRRNMLDSRFTQYGLASAKDSTGRLYWALILSR